MGSTYTVSTGISRIIPDDSIHNPVELALIRDLYGKEDFGDAFVDEITNGAFPKFERFYRFAATPGNYAHGLPNTRISHSSGDATAIKAAIDAEVGQSVTIKYARYNYLNYSHLAYNALVTLYGFDDVTNEVTTKSAEKGFPVYLEDMEPVYAEDPTAAGYVSGSNAPWGRSPTAGYTPLRPASVGEEGIGGYSRNFRWRVAGNGSAGVELQLVWTDGADVIQREVVFVPLAPYSPNEQYIQARYSYILNNDTVFGYWIYEPGTGTHPALDVIATIDYTGPGSYFPFVIFKHHGHDFSDPANAGTHEYDSSVALLKKLGMSYEDLSEKVRENPSYGALAQGAMIMGASLNATDQASLEYLSLFFKELHNRVPDVYPTLSHLAHGQTVADDFLNPDDEIRIEFFDTDFKMTLRALAVGRHYRPGIKCAVGDYTQTTNTINVIMQEANADDGVDEISKDLTFQRIYHQVSVGMYEEVVVVNASIGYDIIVAKGQATHFDPTQTEALIPLDYEICRQMEFKRRRILYSRSLTLIFNAYDKQDREWYETGAFASVLKIVAITLLILSWGSSSQLSLALFTTAAGLALVAKFILYQLVVGYIIQAGLVYIGKALGPEWAALFAVAAALYVGAKAMNGNAITIDAKNLWSIQSLSAQTLLSSTTGLFAGAEAALAEDFEELAEDQAEFKAYADELQAELDEYTSAKEDKKPHLDPYLFILNGHHTLMGESPDAYQARTMGSLDPGELSLQIIENYAEHSLTLSVDDLF